MTRGLPIIAALVVVLSGCGGSLQAYETHGGARTHLDGTKATESALTVAQALRRQPQKPVYVVGYMLAPRDDLPRLCTRLNDYADCRGAPAVVLDDSKVNLDQSRALHVGCCATGFWSPHPVVLHLQFDGRRAVVLH